MDVGNIGVGIIGIQPGRSWGAVHYRGRILRGTNLLWEINGTDGDLQITSSGGHLQMFDLALSGAKGSAQTLSPMAVPAQYRRTPPLLSGPSVNVAQAYSSFADDRRNGTRTCPDFDDAVRRHEMVDMIEKSAQSDRLQKR